MTIDCSHRQEEFRLATCASCRGNVQVKVFKCDLHGECTVGKAIAGIHLCGHNRSTPRAKKERLVVTQKVSVTIEASNTKTGMLLEKLTSETYLAKVLLDDGRSVSAVNTKPFVGHKGKRCVVGISGDDFYLVMS